MTHAGRPALSLYDHGPCRGDFPPELGQDTEEVLAWLRGDADIDLDPKPT